MLQLNCLLICPSVVTSQWLMLMTAETDPVKAEAPKGDESRHGKVQHVAVVLTGLSPYVWFHLYTAAARDTTQQPQQPQQQQRLIGYWVAWVTVRFQSNAPAGRSLS